ncbi:MAG TPA: histidine phosphatase family protein, partial [Xanthomonadales bacterium]|nr:histidine phosphatase family protein [Xanthomonadales bacterium]
LPEASQPNVFLCSPYVRARQTLERVVAAMGLDASVIVQDERLREREFGIFDGLTRLGVEDRYPDQARALTTIGKFYHRPPGGESWCDVILRLRSVVEVLRRDHVGDRVLIVAHQVIVNCFRYLLECMDEAEVLEHDRQADVPNCGVTEYGLDRARADARFELKIANHVVPPLADSAPVTTAPDQPTGPK